MVILDSADSAEEVIPFVKFNWYASEEDFDEEGNLTIDISSGRLRHRWVPANRVSAKLFLREHPDAEGLRSRGELFLVEIYSEDVEDVTDKYEDKLIEGLSGLIVKTPIRMTIPKRKLRSDPKPHYTVSRDLVNKAPAIDIDSIQVGIMTPTEIREMSAVEVMTHEAFIKDSGGADVPVIDGIHDLHMGSMDKEVECLTCGKPYDEMNASNSCPGHFGRLELEIPIPKLMYLGIQKNDGKLTDPLLFTLNHCCHSCSNLLLPNDLQMEIVGKIEQQFAIGGRNVKAYQNIRTILKQQFDKYWKSGVRKECPHCGDYSPKVDFKHTPKAEFYIKEPDARYLPELGELVKKLEFETVHSILENIPLHQCKFFGFDPDNARPQNMFWTVVPIAPNTIRPQAYIPGKDLALNDLTMLYQDVIFANNNLRQARSRGLAETTIVRQRSNLYLGLCRIYDNRLQRIGSGGTATVKSYQGGEKQESYKGIINRLEGKRGRFRSNLQAKYVEEVGYSTIGPNGDLAIDEVGVPIEMCMRVGIEEKVTKDNIGDLQDAIINGPYVYPGALSVCLDGNTYNQAGDNWKELAKSSKEGREWVAKGLQYGSIVKRHAIQGDIGLFNRAPSLHRQSVMAVRVVPLPHKNLSFNATICDPFNADYDGDAMKLHFVQTEEAREEAKQRMLITKNLIHARYGKLAIANDQDQVSGIYLLSHTNKRRKGEWNPVTGLGYTDEGIPYMSAASVRNALGYVYSQNRKTGDNRKIESYPSEIHYAPDGTECYTGRALFSHLFTVLDCEYVSAEFQGNTPQVDEEGNIIREGDELDEEGIIIKKVDEEGNIIREGGKPVKEIVRFEKGKLIKGTLEKNAFGAGGGSIAPAFIYHEGYEKGLEKLTEFIEMSTRLGLAAHRLVGFTMGVADVQGGPEARAVIDQQYEEAAQKIKAVQDAFNNGSLIKFADNHDEQIFSDMDPVAFMEEKIYNITEAFEKAILEPIQDFQGSGNPMQISVRSKARGKDSNVQQMGGSYGLVMVGGERIKYGVNSNRVMPHYPMGDTHPKYTGFVKNGYSSGMNPTEYWLTSSGGRRSAVESGMGNISKSGYLERKMIKGIESYVVDSERRVVNLRTNRIVSPVVGEDGLKPFHIRGDDDDRTNGKGHILTLQPLYFDFECKHGVYLADNCEECRKGSDVGYFEEQVLSLSSKDRIKPSTRTTSAIISKIGVRELTKPNVRKLANRYTEFYRDSLCDPGEAIGATAGGCMGEPATQAALRTFHFAGKVSFQGSIDRLIQILESPLKKSTPSDPLRNEQTIFRLKKGVTLEEAENLRDSIRTVLGHRVIDLVEYDLEGSTMLIKLNWDKVALYRINKDYMFKRFSKVIENYGGEVIQTSLDVGQSILVNLNLSQITNAWFLEGLEPIKKLDAKVFLFIKEQLMQTTINGYGSTEFALYLHAPDDKKFQKDRSGTQNRFCIDARICQNGLLNTFKKHLSHIIDFEYTETSNIGWIYKEYGLEAALQTMFDEIDFQMNGSGGIGEYDIRYISTICDILGEQGVLSQLGYNGLMAYANPSMLGGASSERIKPQFTASSIMGQLDPLSGVAESVAAGKTLRVGNYIPNDP